MTTALSLSSHLRDLYAEESARIQREFEATSDGRAALARRTSLVENLIRRLWQEKISPEESPVQFRARSPGRIRARLAVSLL